jgi:excisionase family DNA binding protein
MAGKLSAKKPEVPDEPAFAYSVAQAARHCDLSERTLRAYINRGELRVCRLERRILIRPAALEEFLISHELGPTDSARAQGS